MRGKLLLFLSFIALFHSEYLFSQQDTVFWFAAPNVSSGSGDSPVFLRFSTYSLPATIAVSLPANGSFTPLSLSIPAQSTDSINLSAYLSMIESPAADLVSDNGLKITSTSPVSAFYEVKAATNKEIFSLKGTNATGTDFYTPFQKFWNNATTSPAGFSSIEIVATENNTTVLITPKTAVTGHAQNVTYSVTLNSGQTYSARDVNITSTTSLAGSIISSNKPVSVTVFEESLQNGSCSDIIGDQITPSSINGTDYIIHKGTASTDRTYILASQNNTSVTVYGSTTSTTVLSWGETLEIPLVDEIYYIKATKPVYTYQVTGFGCDLSSAQLPAIYCAGKNEIAFTRTTSDSLLVDLYIRSGFENQFLLNGIAGIISSSSFQTVPGTSGNFMSARVAFTTSEIPVGTYNLISNAGDIFGMGISQGNSGNGASFAMLSDFQSAPFVFAGNDTTICANISLPLYGSVNGGSVTGTWSGTGYGTFANTSSSLTNTYIPSPLDTLISPVYLILTSTGPCPVKKDTLILQVNVAPLVNASADLSVCSNNSLIQLNGAVSGGSSTGFWTTIGGTGTFSPDTTTLNSSYTPDSNDIAGGTLQFILTSTNNGSCLAVQDTMEVTFTVAPVVNCGADTLIYCSNNASVQLSGTVSGATTTGKWTSTGNGVFSPNNLALNAGYQPGNSDLSTGQSTIYLESTNNGNCQVETDSVIVLYTSSPIVDAGTNQLTCTNDPVIQLQGSVSGPTSSGVWSGGNGTFSASATVLSATYTPTPAEINSGSLLLTLTSTNNGNCISANDVVQINFVAPPYANFNVPAICEGNGSQFTDYSLPGYGSVTSWNWNFGNGTYSTVQNPDYEYNTAGSYPVTLIIENSVGCFDTITKQATIYPLPQADFSYTSACINNTVTVTFQDHSTSQDPIQQWYYDFGGQGASATQNPVHQFNFNGNYEITEIITTTNGCKDSIAQILVVPALPSAGFYYNTDNGLNVGAIFNFIDTSENANAFYWTFGNTSDSYLQDPSNTYYSNGNYLVTQYVYNDLGCYDSTSVWISINTVTTEINTLIPNVISPNGDGKNDVWKLDFIQLMYPEAIVEIYNQWGQQLFYSEGYDIPWDATYSGEIVPDGNYFYIIRLDGTTNSDNTYKGALTVLKSKN